MSKIYVFYSSKQKKKKKKNYGFTVFSLSTISNYELVIFISFYNNKKNILVIAIVYLQFIFINLSMCSILTKSFYIYIYIYLSSCTWTLKLQKTHYMNSASCIKISYKTHVNTTI